MGIDHIVIFQQVAADLEVLILHPVLGGLDHPPSRLCRDGQHGVAATQRLLFQKRLCLQPAKAHHQLVFHGNEEARAARVALARRPAAQLVVDPAGLVPGAADHVQPAQLAHAFHLGHVAQEKGHFGLVCPQCGRLGRGQRPGLPARQAGEALFQCLPPLAQSQGVGGSHPGVFQHLVDRRQHLLGQLAAQLDIHASPGHVGGDDHAAIRPAPGNDLALLVMVAGVQHQVRDPIL